ARLGAATLGRPYVSLGLILVGMVCPPGAHNTPKADNPVNMGYRTPFSVPKGTSRTGIVQ
ncbi:MAG: hypothetical protein J6A01_04780, partial [Proteobacteria bacterium]|nr:hypothetical protein [Pseudomonadota bacterium]